MREALFILAIILVLFGLTAIRYRRQIAGMIALSRAFKDAKNAAAGARTIGRNESASVQLAQCGKCGVWVPQSKAFVSRDGTAYCSAACQKSAAKA